MSDEFSILDPTLEQDRHVYTAPLPDEDMDAMFADIAAVTVDEEPGLLRRVQDLPTRLRTLIGLAVAGALSTTVIALLGLRGDLSEDGGQRMLAALAGLALLGAVSMIISLRGLHRRSLGGYVWLFCGIALLIPPFLSLIPELWPGQPVHSHEMPWEGGCFWFGAAVASLTGTAVLLMQRSPSISAWRAITAAVAGGCAGFITQQLFCPANGTWHILTTHALLGLVVSALFLAGLKVRGSLKKPA